MNLDKFEKKLIGYGLVAILELAIPLIVYYVNLLTFSPTLVAWLVGVIGIVGSIAIAIIRHHFNLPEKEEEQVPITDTIADTTVLGEYELNPSTLS